MIYALDILLLIVSYILSSLIVILNGTIQPYFEKYGVQKTSIGRMVATLALNIPVMIYFPTAFAVIGSITVACQVWYYRDLKKTYSEWSNL